MPITGISEPTAPVTPGSEPEIARSDKDKEELDNELNRFMTLLITQLQNQDPLDPMDANEFTNQLVQFASVEQQIYSNANLEKLVTMQTTSQVAAMVDYIDKVVQVPGNQLPLENGKATFTYTLPENIDNGSIRIVDSSGMTVFTSTPEKLVGTYKLDWDGKNSFGIPQPDGIYTLTVSGTDASGEPIEIDQTIFGRVSGATSEDGVPALYIGNLKVEMDKVIRVQEKPDESLVDEVL